MLHFFCVGFFSFFLSFLFSVFSSGLISETECSYCNRISPLELFTDFSCLFSSQDMSSKFLYVHVIMTVFPSTMFIKKKYIYTFLSPFLSLHPSPVIHFVPQRSSSIRSLRMTRWRMSIITRLLSFSLPLSLSYSLIFFFLFSFRRGLSQFFSH